jgi:hypothetical protein
MSDRPPPPRKDIPPAMPARPDVWDTPEDEAHQLVEQLLTMNAPKPVVERAERIKEWITINNLTMSHIRTLSGGGPWCPTAISQAERVVAKAKYEGPKLQRLLRRE